MKFWNPLIKCMALAFLFGGESSCISAGNQPKVVQNDVELGFDTSKVLPGEKPFSLSPGLLEKLFPEAENPRRMEYNDLQDDESKESFIEQGYAFVLKGDFNRDGFADVAFVGKRNSDNPASSSFIGIVSMRGRKLVREYYADISEPVVVLSVAKAVKPGIDGILVIYRLESDDFIALFWDGQGWRWERE